MIVLCAQSPYFFKQNQKREGEREREKPAIRFDWQCSKRPSERLELEWHTARRRSATVGDSRLSREFARAIQRIECGAVSSSYQ